MTVELDELQDIELYLCADKGKSAKHFPRSMVSPDMSGNWLSIYDAEGEIILLIPREQVSRVIIKPTYDLEVEVELEKPENEDAPTYEH